MTVYRPRDGSTAVAPPPPLALLECFSRFGCGRNFPLFSGVMRGGAVNRGQCQEARKRSLGADILRTCCFLCFDEVSIIIRNQITKHGGDLGLRARSLLQSKGTRSKPSSSFSYGCWIPDHAKLTRGVGGGHNKATKRDERRQRVWLHQHNRSAKDNILSVINIVVPWEPFIKYRRST